VILARPRWKRATFECSLSLLSPPSVCSLASSVNSLNDVAYFITFYISSHDARRRAVISTCIPTLAYHGSEFDKHVTFTFDLLTSRSIYAERLTCTVCLPRLVLIARVVFLLECGHTHSDFTIFVGSQNEKGSY